MIKSELILDGDTLVIKHSENVQPVLERNKILRDETDGYNADKTFKHEASIPLLLITQWKNDGIADFYTPEGRDTIMKMLNLPEYAYLRTSKGEI